MGLKDRPCDLTQDKTCLSPKTSIFDRTQAPCGKCETAKLTAAGISLRLITQKNTERSQGRDNWQSVVTSPDNFTVEANAFAAPNHHGPLLVRIQNGRQVK